MKKKLYLSRDEYGDYRLHFNKPKAISWGKKHRWVGSNIYLFCGRVFERRCGSLLKRGTYSEVKLTQLKNGIKLEKVGKPS